MRRGVAADLVRLADHLSAADAGTGEQPRKARRPVVAAGLPITFGVRPNSPSISTSVSSSRPVRLQVVEQRGDALVERRQQVVLEAAEVVAVRVPVLHAAHVGLHDRHAGLDQPAGQQQRLTEGMPAVAVAHATRLAVQFESGATLPEVSTENASCC